MILAEITMLTVITTGIVFASICFVALLIAIGSTITSAGFKKNFRERDSRRVAEAKADLEVLEIRTKCASKQIELDKLTEQRIERTLTA